MPHNITNTIICAVSVSLCLLFLNAPPCLAQTDPAPDRSLYKLSLFGGQITDNSISEFLGPADNIDFRDSYLIALALSRHLASYDDLLSVEIEGQIVKHFAQQNHWEVNALLAVRWEKFFWDKQLDTSLAIGTGPSYATEVPEIEVRRSGESAHLQAYLLVELEFALPSHPDTAFIIRIHHRSNAFGIVADNGISNAATVGLKFSL